MTPSMETMAPTIIFRMGHSLLLSVSAWPSRPAIGPIMRVSVHSPHLTALPPQRGLRGSGCAPSLRHAVPSLDRLDAACEGLLQDAFTDGRQHEAEKPSLEVLAVADHDEVDVGRAVGTPREVVSVTRIASPRVGVGGLEDDVVGIGPVVVQTFPDAARALRDVGVLRALVMHLEVLVGAVTEESRAARPEVGQPSDVLLGRQPGGLVEVDRGHACSFLLSAQPARTPAGRG